MAAVGSISAKLKVLWLQWEAFLQVVPAASSGGGGLSPKGFLEVVIGDEQKMKKYEKPLVLLLFQACT